VTSCKLVLTDFLAPGGADYWLCDQNSAFLRVKIAKNEVTHFLSPFPL
jgi:hypothetical protein